MRLLFRLFLMSLCFASADAQLCGSSREFAVDNCTACPTFDQSRSGSVRMAMCAEGANDTGGNVAYTCVCGNVPTDAMVTVLEYYAQIDGNVTRCVPSWATAPVLFTLFSVISAGTLLYAAAHMFYIAVLSRICCCAPHGCTKINAAALVLGVGMLLWCPITLSTLMAQGDIAIATGPGHGFDVLSVCAVCLQIFGQTLLYTSIFDVAYPGQDKARRRCCFSSFLWGLSAANLLTYISAIVLPRIQIHSDILAWFPIFSFVFPFVIDVVTQAPVFVAYKAIYDVSVHPVLHGRVCIPNIFRHNIPP